MRSPTFAMILCLACATTSWAQNDPAAGRAAKPPPAAETPAPPEPARKEEGGLWNWLRGKDSTKPDGAAKVEMPERMERPERIERPERASGGCCQ